MQQQRADTLFLAVQQNRAATHLKQQTGSWHRHHTVVVVPESTPAPQEADGELAPPPPHASCASWMIALASPGEFVTRPSTPSPNSARCMSSDSSTVQAITVCPCAWRSWCISGASSTPWNTAATCTHVCEHTNNQRPGLACLPNLTNNSSDKYVPVMHKPTCLLAQELTCASCTRVGSS